MKSLVILATLLVSLPALAIDGTVVTAPAKINVIDENGQPAEFVIPAALNTGDIDLKEKSIALTNNGVSAMCGDYLGQLAADFTVTVKDEKGKQTTATIRAAAKGRKVSAFGTCEGKTNILDQLQIDVDTGEGIELK